MFDHMFSYLPLYILTHEFHLIPQISGPKIFIATDACVREDFLMFHDGYIMKISMGKKFPLW